jgi:hypothetical protein
MPDPEIQQLSKMFERSRTFLAEMERHFANNGTSINGLERFICRSRECLTLHQLLNHAEQSDKAAEIAVNGARAAAQLFRESPRFKDWMDPFREGLLMALMVKEDLLVSELARWGMQEHEFDAGAFGYSKDDNRAVRELARFIAGDSSAFTEWIETCRSVRANAIRDGYRALAVRDLASMSNANRALASDMKRIQSKRPFNPLLQIDLDCSIIWHLARLCGWNATGLPDEAVVLRLD